MNKFLLAFLCVLCFTIRAAADKPHISVPYNNSAYRYNPFETRRVYVYPIRTYPYYYQDYRVNYYISNYNPNSQYLDRLMMKTYEKIINDIQNRGQGNQ